MAVGQEDSFMKGKAILRRTDYPDFEAGGVWRVYRQGLPRTP
jgi:hypothetical protein